MQVEKQFNTSAPIEDKENYINFAKVWIYIIEIPHQLEEVQFPFWDTHIQDDVAKDRAEHRKLFANIAPFKLYLEDVLASTKPWDGFTARSLTQAFLPIVMRYFVEELYPLDAEILKEMGLTLEEVGNTFKAVAIRGREIMDIYTTVLAMTGHNAGSEDWPPLPKEVKDQYPFMQFTRGGGSVLRSLCRRSDFMRICSH